jgi:tRNA nucleotidyltransferase (CCA-adding enzyme)
VPKTAEFGFGGDALPGQEPQAANDAERGAWSERWQHDEPDYEPGTADYNFFYGNGQLHVSPHHNHDELRSHAGVPGDHVGPLAVGHVSVDRGRATWHVSGNVALRGLFTVLKDYSKQVGWRWGGLTDLDGDPIDDDFAPKKAMVLRDHEFAVDRPFALQGKTAHVGKDFTKEMREALRSADYKVAEYPGGGNFMDTLKRKEDLEQNNLYDPNPKQDTEIDQDQPTGTFKCPKCGLISPNWSDYMAHRSQEDENLTKIDPADDGKFPPLPDMDKTLPNNFIDRQPRVMPLASWKEAARVDGFDLYASLWGYDNDDHRHYGAFLRGQLVGYATVHEIEPGRAEVVMVQSSVHGAGVGEALARGLQVYYRELVTHAASPEGQHLASRLGMVSVGHQRYKWSAGSEPKDMIDAPVPFVYDVQEDRIVVGQPGSRHSDVPGPFTPGGIVEGTYEPGGKVTIKTLTNIPYSTRHMLDLWYWSHPHMEITGLEQELNDGTTKKLAKEDVGQYIKRLAATDPAAWRAYQALRKAGGKVYVVGGAVRDALMQKEPKDIDLMVTGVPSEQVNYALEDLPGRVDLTGKKFGVYRYRQGNHEVEIALPRTERSTGDRRVDFDVSVDHNLPVEDDLLRRDFTVNAMAVDLDNGRLVDPYDGAGAIASQRLQTTHPDSFAEDPTRLVRALVMNSRYGFQPDERTRQEMKQHSGRLPLESNDAKQGILEKLFSSDNPARGIRLAHDTGLLRHIFPEVETHWNYDQQNPHHNYPLGEHLLNVLENTAHQSTDPDLRVAALLHDIGKPASRWDDPETGIAHYYRGPDGQGQNHEEVGADMAEGRLATLRWPVARRKRIHHLISHHMFPAFSSPKGARKFLHRVGDEHADDLLTLRWADQHGKGQTPAELSARTSVEQQRGLVEAARSVQAPTNTSALAINGSDILTLGVKPGPQIGQILRRLTDDVVDDPHLNERDVLLERAQEYINATAR